MLFYSQNFEDVYLWRCFGDSKKGFYVDVGSFDPVEESVTKIFYDVGWCGVNLDPSSVAIGKFEQLRPRDRNLPLLAWDVDAEEVDFFESATTGRSTAVDSFRRYCEQDGVGLSARKVGTITLDSVLADVSYEAFHFLKIDAEGAELRVLRGLDLKRHRPRIIVVESVDPRLEPCPDDQEISALLVAHDYHPVFFDGVNRYWCADEWASLDRCFALPPGCRDGIRPYQVFEAQKRAYQAEVELRSLRSGAAGRQGEVGQPLKFLLVSHPSPGLKKDREVVAALLKDMGHTVTTVEAPGFYFQQAVRLPLPEEDIGELHVIMFEHVFLFAGRPKARCLYVNPEWLLDSDIERIEAGEVDVLLAKSRDAERRLGARFPALSVVYTGFASPRLGHEEIQPDYGLVLHARGNASQKGTSAVLKAYGSDRAGRLPDCLCTMRTFDPAVPEFVSRIRGNCLVIFRDIGQQGFDKIARKRGIHLCPSEREGFGHYIFGPMSSGAIVLTTNAPPMNEIVSPESGFLLEAEIIDRGLYVEARVSPLVIRDALLALSEASAEAKALMSKAAIERGRDLAEDFRQRFEIFVALLACLPA